MLAPPEDRTKWFAEAAVGDYQSALNLQLGILRLNHGSSPHARDLVMYGPPGACWISTQVLTKPDGKYHIIGCYRSLDKAHWNVDAAVQLVIGAEIINDKNADVELITLLVGSFHEYLSQSPPE